MAGDAAGQITASLTLDISKFTKALGDAQKAVSDMQKTASQAASAGGGDAATESAKKAKKAADDQKKSIASVAREYKTLVNAVKNSEISQDKFVKGMHATRAAADKLKSGIDRDTDAYVKLGTVSSQAKKQIDMVAESQRRAEAAAKREADAIVAESERKARAQERATQRAVNAINKSIKASTKLVNQSKGRGSKKQIDPNVATMAIAQKNVAALNKEIGRGAITYAAAAQQLDILEKEIIQAGSGAQRGTKAFRQFQTSMEVTTGAKRFISNQQAMQQSAQQTAAALKGSTSKMGSLFKVMGAGMASSSRSMVMSVTNITEAFQKGQMGGRMLSTFLLGDLMDALMIGSFATDGLVKSANALPAAMGGAKAAMLSVARFFPIAMVGANLLAAGIGILVRKFSDSGKSAKEAKDEIAALDQQIRETSKAIVIIMGHFKGLDGVFKGLDKSIPGVADAIRVLGENFSDIKKSSDHLDDLEAKMQALKNATPGEKIMAAATADAEKMAEESQRTKENYQAQTASLAAQTKRLEEMKQKLSDMKKSQGKKGSALQAFFLDRRITEATLAIEKQTGVVTGASAVYTAAKGAAEEYAASLDEIRKKAEELDKAQKKADGEKRREKAVDGLIAKYNRLKPLFEATADSGFEKDVKQAQKFAAEMAKIIKTLKKFKGVKAAKDFLQAKGDNEFIEEVNKNNEALEDFKQRAEEAKKRASDLLREAGKQTTLKMGIGTASQIGVMTPEQKLRQRLRTKDPEQEALLAKVRSFKKGLTDLGLSSGLATKALNLIPVAVIDMAAAMSQFADELISGVGNMAMGNFGDTFKLAGKGAGMAVGAAMGVDPETAGKVGEALGAFSDMMVGKIDVTSAAGNQYNMGEVIQAAFDQPLNAVADAFMPLAEAAHLLASNFGGFLAQMITTFKPLISAVGTIFSSVFEIIANVFGALMPVFLLLATVINPVAKLFAALVRIVTPIINVILGLASVLLTLFLSVSGLTPILLLLAPAIDALAKTIMGWALLLEIGAADLGETVAKVIETFAEMVRGVIKFLQEMDVLGLMGDSVAALADGIDALAKNVRKAGNGFGAFANGMDETIAGMDRENKMRDEANKEASKVLNAPKGFKVEKYRYEAMNPEQSNPFNQSSQMSPGNVTINIENMNVTDYQDFQEQINEANNTGGPAPFGGF